MPKAGKGRVANILAGSALLVSLVSTAMSAMPAAFAADERANQTVVECQYHTDLEYEMNMPIYYWAPVGEKPKGVVLAMHGLAMHGQAFDELAKKLAGQGFIVYSTDMRGYGRLTKDYPHEFCGDKDCKQKVNYKKSQEDLLRLTDRVKADHKGLPLYLVGESMGADMAIRIASARPELADGLILSSPAIRAHTFIDANAMKVLPVIVANYKQQLDLLPYVRKYASNDPKVVKELCKDPLMRKRMSGEELVASRRCINETIAFVPNLSPDKPVLVLQAKDDKCVRADAIVMLMSRLKAQDQQVRWFDERGHILIETSHIKPDTMETIVGWLNDHDTFSKTALQTRTADELISVDSSSNKAADN